MSKSGFPWNSLARLLTKAHTWSGQQTFSNINVTGGSITGAVTTLPMATSTNPGVSAATTVTIVDANSGVIILQNDGSPAAQTIGSPTVVTAGKIFTVVNNDTSVDNVVVNGFTVTPGEAQSFIWDGSAWGPTDLGITSIPVPITQGGTGSSTAAGAFTNIKQAATTSATGVVELETVAETVAGAGTAMSPTGAGVAATIAVNANPKAMSQGVALTAAAAPAILNAHSTVFSNTTNSFGIGGDFILPTWTPAANQVLRNKWAANVGYKIEVVLTSGIFRLTLNDTVYDSAVPGGGAASNLVAGTGHKILAVPTVGASTTTVSFFLDGNLLSTTEAQANEDVTNTQDMYTGGTSAARYAMTVFDTYNFNRALTAAEVLDLYRNGIAEADKWGSQTSLVTGDNSTFASDTGWWSKEATVSIADGVAHFVDAANAGSGLNRNSVTFLLPSKRYRVIYTISNYVKGGIRVDPGGVAAVTNPTRSANGTYTEDFEVASSGNGKIYFSGIGAGLTTLDIDNVTIYQIGATLALESEGIQPAPGQCLDSSSNKLHAMQPAAGSSLTRYKKDFEYRWTNTWTASSAAQYVGGLNQAVLSADHFITDIITQATVTTDVENLELGDGSAVAKFVAAFAPSATRTKQTIAAQNDGTNLKLVYTPAAEATMTVETIIRGFIWEP
jgi:hypothetical protein